MQTHLKFESYLKLKVMIETILKNVKKGSIFRKKPDLDSLLYVRDHYDRSSKKYAFHPYDDYNKEFFGLGSNMVYVDAYDDLYDNRKSYFIK